MRSASFVDTLLSHCPDVRVLATSRELLGVRGEQTITVAPLGVGDNDQPGDAVDAVRRTGSRGRARLRRASQDVALIAEVCRRLDGLPLAIELAAARMRSMSLRQLADRLDDRFRVLTSGPRAAAERQRTLEAVVVMELRPPRRARTVGVPPAGRVCRQLHTRRGDGGRRRGARSSPATCSSRLATRRQVARRARTRERRIPIPAPRDLRQYGREQLTRLGERDESAARLDSLGARAHRTARDRHANARPGRQPPRRRVRARESPRGLRGGSSAAISSWRCGS